VPAALRGKLARGEVGATIVFSGAGPDERCDLDALIATPSWWRGGRWRCPRARRRGRAGVRQALPGAR
jgi:hypothetical protein